MPDALTGASRGGYWISCHTGREKHRASPESSSRVAPRLLQMPHAGNWHYDLHHEQRQAIRCELPSMEI
jgi:hypothetical protein